MVISKSEFMMFLKHPAWLWLKKYDKNKIPIPDEDLQARFDEGTLFEEYAEKLFPKAVKLGYKNNGEFSGTKYYSLPETTKKELNKNTKVILQGRVEIDLSKQLGSLTSIFDVLERIEGNTFNLYEIKSSTTVKPKDIPDISPRYLKQGSMEEWLEIFKLVKGDLPQYSIYKLSILTPKKVGLLEDMGIKLIDDIPLDFDLSEKQQKQVEAVKTGERDINREDIKEFLSTFEFPLHFFDYETMSSVIPIFDGTRPYQQVPFQYSLHIQKDLKNNLIHKEYLHTENSNPVLPLLKQMQKDFDGKGSIVSWYKQFEMKRNDEMALMYPEFKSFLQNLNDRMVDLMIPFSKGWFVDKDFFGSASLKAVLPVLAPELSYKELEVSHGGQAQRIWMETILNGKSIENKDKIMDNLRKYCTLDTYAMYVIYKYLVSLI